ncbi:hypothetical protein F5Y15DRAFT_430446 [Xylariaceae sp. FL0016]|nr:hypothetical protein F5Y15DRAFT_430446 [Xylariaceae sp. FL0016]
MAWHPPRHSIYEHRLCSFGISCSLIISPAGPVKMSVHFKNHFKGFNVMTWDEKFAKHKKYLDQKLPEKHGMYFEEDSDDAGTPLSKGLLKCLMRGHWLIKGGDFGDGPRLVVSQRGAGSQAAGTLEWDGVAGDIQFSSKLDNLPHDFGARDPDDDDDAEDGIEGVGVIVDEMRARVKDLKTKINTVQSGVSSQVKMLEKRLLAVEARLGSLTEVICDGSDVADMREKARAVAALDDSSDWRYSGHSFDTPSESPSPPPQTGKRKRDQDSESVEDPHPLRLYFIWRGANPEDDDDRGKRQGRVHSGHVDFETKEGVVFHGTFDGSFIGADVGFTGYKISDDGGPPGV